MIEKTLLVVVALFPISEIVLAVMKRSRDGRAQNEDRGSMRLLWLSILVGSVLAFAAQWVPWGRFNVSRSIVVAVALALMVFGLVIRWTAIVQLGRFFTVDVAIHTDHDVVQRGLYCSMRHPTYTGLLIAFLGLGVFFRELGEHCRFARADRPRRFQPDHQGGTGPARRTRPFLCVLLRSYQTPFPRAVLNRLVIARRTIQSERRHSPMIGRSR